MASRFDTTFAAVGFPMLLDEFGEPVTYYFAAGGVRSIRAIIERNPPAVFDQAGNALIYDCTIRVLASGLKAVTALSGVLSSEVYRGGDAVQLLRRVDDIAVTKMQVVAKISEDSGVLTLALSGG